MKIAMVCPYSLKVPGGVQNHVLDLASSLRSQGHDVAVLAPDTGLPTVDGLECGGRTVALPYNGSIARVAPGPDAMNVVRRWLRSREFDVLHVHEPMAPSLAMFAVAQYDGPIVATFHSSAERSLLLRAAQPLLRPLLERITARIAVSEHALRTQRQHFGTDAVLIGNGVRTKEYARAHRGAATGEPVIGFLGRYDEARKGMPTLLAAARHLLPEFPRLSIMVVGPGNERALRARAGVPLRSRIDCRGVLTDADKASALRAMDVFVAPNLKAESFGMILTEAMAAGTPVVASQLTAFCRVAEAGARYFPVGDADALARTLRTVVSEPAQTREMVARGRARAAQFDWSVISTNVLRVYETAIAASPIPQLVT